MGKVQANKKSPFYMYQAGFTPPLVQGGRGQTVDTQCASPRGSGSNTLVLETFYRDLMQGGYMCV